MSLAERYHRLESYIQEKGLDAAVITKPQNIFYFTGVYPRYGQGFAIFAQGKCRVILAGSDMPDDLPPEMEISLDYYNDYSIEEVIIADRAAGEALQKALGETVSGRGVIGLEGMPGSIVNLGMFADYRIADIDEFVRTARKTKYPDEIEKITASIDTVDRAILYIEEILTPGITEIELASKVREFFYIEAGIDVNWEACLGSGPRTADPDVQPSDRVIRRGDIVLADIFPNIKGYYGDTTRTFILGRALDRHKEIHGLLERALAAGEKTLGPGVPASEVDKAIRKSLEHNGFGGIFPHHSGHGFGLSQLEQPYIIPGDNSLLEPGQIIALEPGLYIRGFGGMRLESNYLIIENGFRALSNLPKELVEVI